jgi:outer membrane protein TolC
MQSSRRAKAALTLSAIIALVTSGCGHLEPKPLGRDELQTQNAADRAAALRDVPPLSGSLSLEEAIARALKYNLDSRTKLMEEAVARGQYDLSRYDLLPKLLVNAAYESRDEDRTTLSKDSVTGSPSLANPSIFSDREHSTVDLALSWNLLDFGLSYYTAQQNANRLLIAGEHRRKAMHGLVQDVRIAFWRAAAAQKLQQAVRGTLKEADMALDNARKAETASVRSPVESLRYQRQLIENLRLLEAIDQELSSARVELANLINAPFSVPVPIADSEEPLNRQLLETPVQVLEEQALAGNADLREQHYNARNAVLETRRTLLRLFPNLQFSYGAYHDNDSYLIHHQWNQAGAGLSYNLMNALSIPAQRQFAQAGVQLADQHRVATQMAVLTQVNLAALQYANAYRQFERADELWQVDARLESQVANQVTSGRQSELDGIANRTTTILSQLRRYQALAQANAADSKLQATLGLEPQLPDVETTALPELTAVVRTALSDWRTGKLLTPGANQ